MGGLDKQSNTASVSGNQSDTFNSGAYDDGYRDGYQTAKHTFLEQIEATEHQVGQCERLKQLARKVKDL